MYSNFAFSSQEVFITRKIHFLFEVDCISLPTKKEGLIFFGKFTSNFSAVHFRFCLSLLAISKK